MQGEKLMRCGWGVVWLLSGAFAFAATEPASSKCTADVNRPLMDFVMSNQGSREAHQDNVMVCGTMVRDSAAQGAGRGGHGAHQLLVISVPTTSGQKQVVVVTNDNLDGVVNAYKGDAVFAYGQAYVDPGPMRSAGTTVVAGVHETHCATHRGADDGWVFVNNHKYPFRSCGAH
jgi:hypothetical protein